MILDSPVKFISHHKTNVHVSGMKKYASLAIHSAMHPFHLEPVTLHKSYGKIVILSELEEQLLKRAA